MFLGEGLSAVCSCVHGGLSASKRSQTTITGACVSGVPATGETKVCEYCIGAYVNACN